MYKTGVYFWVNICISMVLLFFTKVNGDSLKAFSNPLNNKAVDLFILVDEENSNMNTMHLGLMKTALHNIAVELNPTSSTPYFGVYFYGATSAVNTLAAFPTISVPAVKVKLDLKQYSRMESNPSTLVLALNTVNSLCQSHCRPGVASVVVILASTLDLQAESTIRQLERNRGMTVIVVAIGPYASPSALNRLASHPLQYYAVPVASFYELILATSHISSVISDVPRLLAINILLPIPSTLNGIYYTVQLNTYPYTITNDTIVMFASNCEGCFVYGSLSEPNPISANTLPNTKRHNFNAAAGYPNSLYYFRIPKSTSRFYLSFQSMGMSSVQILANVFSLPDMMQISTKSSQVTDFSQMIG